MDKISDARNEILVACKMYAVSDNMREAVREILQKLVEGVQTQTTNSRYVTALDVFSEWCNSDKYGFENSFVLWCKERLNAEK